MSEAPALRQEFKQSLQRRDFKRARQIAETGRQIFPDDMNFILDLAKQEYVEGNQQRAFDLVKAILGKNNRGAGVETLLLGAKILRYAQQHSDEKRFLSAALEMFPDNGHAAFAAGNFYRRLRDWRAALPHFQSSSDEIALSSGFELEALYCLGLKKEFLERYHQLMEQGVATVVSGTLASHAEIEMNIKLENAFCASPMDFTYSRDIESGGSFFTDALAKIEEADRFRPQTLLENGDQTGGNLFFDDPSLRHELDRIIKRAVREYCEIFGPAQSKFTRVLRTADLTINAWAIRMQPRGFLNSHIHERGWLSGTIYLKTPPRGATNQGDIIFSTAGGDLPSVSNGHLDKRVVVKEGLINLFPASLFHRTVPFDGARSSRVCIAFDVCPMTLNGRDYLQDY